MSQHIDQLTLSGVKEKPGGEQCNVLIRDGLGKILLATGTTVPTDGKSGYAKNCLFIDTDVAAGTSGLYTNIGTTAACNFNLVSSAADV